MAGHGVPRYQSTATLTEEDRARQQRRIEKYQSLEQSVRDAVKAQDWSDASLQLTSRLLKENPEYSTVWNHRRRILQHLFTTAEQQQPDEAPATIQSYLQADLDFLIPLLMSYPKCYWIWKHRLWLLEQFSVRFPPAVASKAWQAELALDGKMLSRDNRNFHGWGYRRRVVQELLTFASTAETPASGKSLTEQEFDFTTSMLRSNLSNFSAWHNRSTLLPQLLVERKASEDNRKNMFDSELAFLKDGLFIDPADQSLWFYHQYLMYVLLTPKTDDGSQTGSRAVWVTFNNHDREERLRAEIEEIRELLEDPNVADVKLVYQHLLEYSASYLQLEAGSGAVTAQEMREWLTKLTELDPLRSKRWQDLGLKLDLM